MKCAECHKEGQIGKDILFKPDGMVKGIDMKKFKALCSECYPKTKQEQK